MQDNDNVDKKPISKDSKVKPNTLESLSIPKEIINSIDELDELKEKDPTKYAQLSLLIQASRIQSSYSSPLPPPEIIEGYEKILPGSADRILTMTEKQGEHRRKLEESVVTSDIKRSNLGLWLAAGVTTIIVLCATYLAVNGRETTAGIMVGTAMVTLSGNFIYGSIARKNERIEKQQKLLDARYPKD